MKLLEFKANNLFSIGRVKLNLADRGLTLITGYSKDEGSSNGAGKSSVANKGILWALYGQTAGGIRADGVINRHGKRNINDTADCARGEITFEGVDGNIYTVIRERPARLTLIKKHKIQEYNKDDMGLILVDDENVKDEDVSAKKAADTQVIIDRLLGLNFHTFIQTSFFGQGRQMSYAALTPKEQKNVLEQILPFEQIDEWAQYTHDKLSVVKELKSSITRDVLAYGIQFQTLMNQYGKIEESSDAWQAKKEADIAELSDVKFKLKEEFDLAVKQMFIHKTMIKKCVIRDIESELTVLNDKRDVITSENNKLLEKVNEAKDSHYAWTVRRDNLHNEITTLKESKSCPTCLRDFNDMTVAAVTARIAQHKKLTGEAEINIGLAKKALDFYRKQVATKDREICSLEQQINSLHTNIEDRDRLESEIISRERDMDREMKFMNNKIETAKNEKNPFIDTITTMQGSIRETKDAQIQTNEKLNDVTADYNYLEYWHDVYSKELKLKLYENTCPFLDARTAYHLKQLKNNQIHVEFSTIKQLASGENKDEFNVNVWSKSGGQGFDSLSGGEQQMVSFAIGLALADLAGRTAVGKSSFLILDEPFSELDARNSEAIVEYLIGEINKGKNTVFLISNEDILKGLISNRIHITKNNGVSNVSSQR